ncbi:MAG TPA: hypothetical protein VMY37_22965 [Thermoguttaceae bacterium]|nr:hypothetical protein [Thermoguttaceae bacterium]
MMTEALRRAGKNRTFTYDREQFCLRLEGEKSAISNLINPYQEYRATIEFSRVHPIAHTARIIIPRFHLDRTLSNHRSSTAAATTLLDDVAMAARELPSRWGL